MKYYMFFFSNFFLLCIVLGCMFFYDLVVGCVIVEVVLDLGINFFDMVDLYDKGENECILGQVLQGFC